MQLVRDYVQSFYSQNQTELEKAYAGINPDILLSNFKQFSLKKETDYTCSADIKFFEEVLKHKPFEYILHEKFFFRSPFFVNEDVLIPRNETEILVEDSITFINKNYHPSFSIAEVGVGSFALGLSLLIDIKDEVYFWAGDISAEALEVASSNLFRLNSKLNPQTKVELCCSDRLEQTDQLFDLIISNPPYIRESAKVDVHRSVDSSEPHIALYLADDIYNDWFSDFFDQVQNQLKESGAFFMEGHEDTLNELKVLAHDRFKVVEIKKDYTGRDRFLYCYK